jgi:hypothetical protein
MSAVKVRYLLPCFVPRNRESVALSGSCPTAYSVCTYMCTYMMVKLAGREGGVAAADGGGGGAGPPKGVVQHTRIHSVRRSERGGENQQNWIGQ